MGQALLDGLPMNMPCHRQDTPSGSHYYCHFVDEETETEWLSNLSKVTQLGSYELGLEPMLFTTAFCHFIFYIHKTLQAEKILI